jgi:N-acetylglucosamine transport system substrate-binding protein
MADEKLARLVAEIAAHRYSRRQILGRATALGLSAPAIATALAGASMPLHALAQDAANPLGVDPAAPLDVVIFKGGFGDDYAINAEKIYNTTYPDAKIKHTGTTRLGPQYQPAFNAGTPPDIMDNSGADSLDNAALVAEEQLADLADLMAAASFDTEGKTFAESLAAGSQDGGVYDGKQLVLLYALTVYAVWYDKNLFDTKGWTYPQTWEDLVAMNQAAKDAGMALWTYQGKYPQYMRLLFDQMVYKNAGKEAIMKLDNLEDGAWSQDSVKAALTAFKDLADAGAIMEGTEGLTHTESQAAWLQHKAVFIPCGTWLENEMKDVTPADFAMFPAPSPSLAGDTLPFAALSAWAGENFIVPAKGKNVQGGKEFLRILFSKQGAKFFSENTKALTVVDGAVEGLDLGPVVNATQEIYAAAGDNHYYSTYADWYKPLGDESKNQMGELLNGRTSVEDCIAAIQDAADSVKSDDSIKKFTRS